MNHKNFRPQKFGASYISLRSTYLLLESRSTGKYFSWPVPSCHTLSYAPLKYCKLQKLHGRKVSWFNGFYNNVEKTFAVLLLISMKTTF